MIMKNLKKSMNFFTILTVLLFSGISVSAQSTWKIDPAHAKVTFSTLHNTISDVAGLFDSFESTITASKDDFSDASATLSLKTESINTAVEMRDDHLRSADFFEVEKYPEIIFRSTSIEKTDKKNHYLLKGNLTIRNITKPITLDMWYRGTITDSNSGKKVAGFQITGTLNRLDYGVGPKFPEALISNKVQIKVDAEYIQQ